MRITPTLFYISTRLALVWAAIGVPYSIVFSVAGHHLIHLRRS